LIGKKVRLKRIFDVKTDTTVIVPIDHGPEGWWAGIENPIQTIKLIVKGEVNGLLLRRNIAKLAIEEYVGKAALLLRVGCITPFSKEAIVREALTSSVEEAIRLGADAVVYTVFLGGGGELDSIQEFGVLADACDYWEMPLIGEVLLVKGEVIKNPYSAEVIRVAARYIAEEGADIVKVRYTGDEESFKNVIKYCPTPVVIAGGEKTGSDLDVLKMIENAMKAGAKGICIGRNIWDRENPTEMVKAVNLIVKKKVSAEEAYAKLKSLKEEEE